MDQKIDKYLNSKTIEPYGDSSYRFTSEVKLPAIFSPLEWQTRGLMYTATGYVYTATGYGACIPTSTMVRFNNRWYRVYSTIYSNAGLAYIKALKSEISLESWNLEYIE